MNAKQLNQRPLNADLSEAVLSGDGRLTKVLASAARAFLKMPFALLLTGIISFLPMMLYIGGGMSEIFSDLAWSSDFLQLYMPPPYTLLVLVLMSFCFAWSAGPLCWIAHKALYPHRAQVPFWRAFRAMGPIFLIWLGIVLLILIFLLIGQVMDRHLDHDVVYIIYIWHFMLLALLAAMPAYLSLCVPVFTLEPGSWRARWQRMMQLGKNYRWRSLGYVLFCAVLGLFAAFALASVLTALLPSSVRFMLDDWLYLACFGIFWMAMCVMATALYARIRVARAEFEPEDVAEVFA